MVLPSSISSLSSSASAWIASISTAEQSLLTTTSIIGSPSVSKICLIALVILASPVFPLIAGVAERLPAEQSPLVIA
ncbi:hypothetical protein ACEV6Q_12645 [Enterobacter ludwigii]|uniref:hypothetical protein n=1 Tax=Enterobacter ludwigii TaxID=299767 RepID=UPI003BEF3290